MTETIQRIVLASRPVGEPALDNFRLEKLPIPHFGPDEMLLRTRWLSLDPYPTTLDELLWIVKKRFKEKPPVTPESHVCGSHWAMSKTAVTTGQMIETSTPVHEEASDQAAPRLNHVLYDVIPKCMTQ